MPLLTIFVNIISRPYSRSANQVHRRSFSFFFFFYIYIHNIDPYPNSESWSLRPKFRFQIHVRFTISFLSLVMSHVTHATSAWQLLNVCDTTKRLMSSPKCRSVEVINNPARLGSNHREVNCINYKQQ
jgi:hypothetical protein